MSNSWKIENSFNSYEEADAFKNLLQHEPKGATLQFKIQRSNKEEKEIFIVKSRTDPGLVVAIQEVEEQMLINKSKTKKK